MAQAESLRRRDPAQALALANQASGLLDDALWDRETVTATRLAALYGQLGASSDAARLLSGCLDAASRQARAFDVNFFAAAADQQAQLARSIESAQASLMEVYSLAARIDLTTTAQRAESAQFVLLKPFILDRIAVVAEVGLRPLGVH